MKRALEVVSQDEQQAGKEVMDVDDPGAEGADADAPAEAAPKAVVNWKWTKDTTLDWIHSRTTLSNPNSAVAFRLCFGISLPFSVPGPFLFHRNL